VLFETGGFQLDELQGLVGWLEANDSRWSDKDWILDVGANIGTSSIPLALETGRRVLALEPDPSNFGYLQTNVAANDLENQVMCLQVAISNRAGKVKMVVDPISSGSTEMWEVGMPYPANALIDVDAKTLDDILRAQGISPNQVGLVWSDTQGFERQVIESGRSLWSAGTPLYVEVWPPGLSRHGGMDQLTQAMIENFDTMIGSQELANRRARAVSRPVREFEAHIRTQPATFSDVLLIPRRG
jgi:FkbM family methyltransferase